MNLKLELENYLHKIDDFFKEKSQKDTYYVYIMIIGVVATISYPFYDLSTEEFAAAQEKVQTTSAKINMDKTYLAANPEAKIVMIDRDIKRLEAELLINKENNEYIKSKIDTISALVYDERAWGEYIDSIAANAKKYNVKILTFTNEYAKNKESFGHILDISLEVKGNYTNTLRFINSLEKSDLVVDIHDLDIKAENALNTNLNISVWGITY